MQSVKKTSVKDKLDGNEIDLSLLELTEVPVKELAAVPRGTVLDLSNNKLVILPSIFPTLTHLVKLDLSKNQLKELPVDFGNLRNLRHLDLYSNKLQRLPVSFHQLKELRFLDLKDNPLVPTLSEAAGDCVDHKGCQEAAKKVVKLMTVVYTELERKRQKEQEEAKAQQLAQKQEEDRAREKSRLEKKAEKDKRKEESQKRNQQTIPENKPIAKNKHPSEIKNGKKMQRKQDQSPPPINRTGPSFFSRLFTVLSRLLILATVAFCVVFALNWSGPLTLDNATVVAHRSVNKIELFYKDSCQAAEPHLRTVRQQWANFSRYVAENGRDLAIVAWDKTKHYAQVVKQRANVSWPVVQKRAAEVVDLTGDTLKHCWEVIAREAPIYYRSVVEKVTELYHKTVSGKTA